MMFSLLVIVLVVAAGGCYRVILNEDDLTNSCAETCSDIGTIHNQHDCTIISDCKYSSTGWIRDFVNCNNCDCDCYNPESTKRDSFVATTKVSIKEFDLYNTCRGTCPKSGLVKSNYNGCEQVRECTHGSNGELKGFVRCDYCNCDCVKTYYVSGYRLLNMKYDLNAATLVDSTPKSLVAVTLENLSDSPQTVTSTKQIATSTTTSVTNSRSMEVGISVTVSGGVTVGVVEMSRSLTATLTTGFTYSSSNTLSETGTVSVDANILVPARSTINAMITARRETVDVPYTADLERTYANGHKTVEESYGVYKNVAVTQFHVVYEPAEPIASEAARIHTDVLLCTCVIVSSFTLVVQYSLF